MSEKILSRRAQEFPGQHEGEAVDFVFRQHPLVMRKALFIGLFAIVLAVLPFDFPQIYSSDLVVQIATWWLWVLLALTLVVWFHRWVGWWYSVYIVTDRRVIEIRQIGFFNRRVNEWQLNNISNVNYEIGGFQAVLFGYGTVIAQSYLGDFIIKTVHKPAEIHEQLLAAVRAAGGGSTRPGR